jgi:hypothetical protein
VPSRRLVLRHPAVDRPRRGPLGHLVLPVVLIGIGLLNLIDGGAFGF